MDGLPPAALDPRRVGPPGELFGKEVQFELVFEEVRQAQRLVEGQQRLAQALHGHEAGQQPHGLLGFEGLFENTRRQAAGARLA